MRTSFQSRLLKAHTTSPAAGVPQRLVSAGLLPSAYTPGAVVTKEALRGELMGLGLEVDKAKKSMEIARREMRRLMLEQMGSLPIEKLGKLVLKNQRLHTYVLSQAKQSSETVASAGKGKLSKDAESWTRAAILEGLAILAEEDHTAFVQLVGDDKVHDPIMRAGLESILKNADFQPVDEIGASASTDLASEPRSALLEWGAMAMRTFNHSSEMNAIAQREQQQRDFSLQLAKATMRRAPERFTTDEMAQAAPWTILIGYAWAACGFPLLQPTHTLAAALMATGMPHELVPEIGVPWDTFAVLIPDGMLPPVLANRAPLKLVGLARWGEGQYTAWAAEEDNAALWTWEVQSLADLMVPQRNDGEPDTVFAIRELIGRLVVGTIIEIDNPAMREIARRGPPTPKSEKKDKAKTSGAAMAHVPSTWSWVLRRAVTIDLRPWVREYVSVDHHSGGSASVRVLVRGHHKRQVCGVGRKERKWIHVAPYWKGDVGLPVAVRPLRIDLSKKDPS